MKKRIYVALCAAGIAFVASGMSFEEAKKRADAGDGHMAYQTGIMLAKGDGVKANPEQAFVYFEKAIKAGDINACVQVLNLIEDTKDTEHSKLFGDCVQQLWNDLLIPYI